MRIYIISLAALASMGIASAGSVQVEIGGPNGINNAYITGDGTVGSVGTAAENNYNNVLFSYAMNGATAPKAFSTYVQTGNAAGSITDSAGDGGAGVTFAMINEPRGPTQTARNFWNIPEGSANTSMTIPINVYDATDVWTMINTGLASSGVGASGGINKDVTIYFNFGSAANQTTNLDAVKLKLTDSTNSSTPTGQTQNAIDCTPLTLDPCGSTIGFNPASGPVLTPATLTLSGGTSSGNIGFTSDNVYAFGFNGFNAGNNTNLYAGVSGGNLNLDDQGFVFNNLVFNTGSVNGQTNQNSWLVSITIADVGNGDTNSFTGVSAVTVDAATPEPSTVALLLVGIGGIGFGAFRRKKQ